MSSASVIGILVPTHGQAPSLPPEKRPIGRAALQLKERGIHTVFGDTVIDGKMTGFQAVTNGWVAVNGVTIHAAHDRFPSQLRAERFAEIQTGLDDIPVGNSLAFTMLCRDKFETQRMMETLGIPMPEVCADPSRFESKLADWGSGFLKPQYGALGVGVQKVYPGDELQPHRPGIVPGQLDPSILQRAVQPPENWASRTVRVLMQRDFHGHWLQGIPVVRQSRQDPVANAARGAEVISGLDALDAETLLNIQHLIDEVGHAIDQIDGSAWALEAGVDLVLDQNHTPWLIEINSRPRGRMEVLADHDPIRFKQAHLDACCRPIERIHALIE
jgi:glutathione synthase/RimK-type ligase-like ATP-grasp enzyme